MKYLIIFISAIFLYSCAGEEAEKSMEDLGITAKSKEDKNILRGEELKVFEGNYIYRDKNPQLNHMIILKWENDSLLAEYKGCETLKDSSITYYITPIYELKLTENGDISFKLKERMLFFEPVKLNQKKFKGRVEYSKTDIIFSGLINGGRIELKCQNKAGCCREETMIFEKDEYEIELSEPTTVFSYKKLVEVGNYGSCRVFELHNGYGEKIKVPEEVENQFDCPSVLILAPDYSYLVYNEGTGLKSYSFYDNAVHTIANFKPGSEGVSGIEWSPNKEKIMFVEINQQKHDSLTQIFIIDMHQGNATNRLVLDLPVNFVCGSFCSSDAGEDFRFKNNQTAIFKRHWSAQYKPEEEQSIPLNK
ncbi:MAG: hypothetical protein JXR58_03080 [Bacteroidales bacterium]|nr:hypothetical protein [Bacteroidales bacterium]